MCTRIPNSSAKRYTGLHRISPSLLHTNTLHTTVNPATAYANSLETKSYTGEFVLSITFRRRLLHAVTYVSTFPHSYTSLQIRHLVLHRRPIVAQQILRQLVFLLSFSLQQALLPVSHPPKKTPTSISDCCDSRSRLASAPSCSSGVPFATGLSPPGAVSPFPPTARSPASAESLSVANSPNPPCETPSTVSPDHVTVPRSPRDSSNPPSSQDSSRFPRNSRSHSSNPSNSSKSARAVKRPFLPAVVRYPPRFWAIWCRRRSRNRREFPARNVFSSQKWKSQNRGVFSSCREAL